MTASEPKWKKADPVPLRGSERFRRPLPGREASRLLLASCKYTVLRIWVELRVWLPIFSRGTLLEPWYDSILEGNWGPAWRFALMQVGFCGARKSDKTPVASYRQTSKNYVHHSVRKLRSLPQKGAEFVNSEDEEWNDQSHDSFGFDDRDDEETRRCEEKWAIKRAKPFMTPKVQQSIMDMYALIKKFLPPKKQNGFLYMAGDHSMIVLPGDHGCAHAIYHLLRRGLSIRVLMFRYLAWQDAMSDRDPVSLSKMIPAHLVV